MTIVKEMPFSEKQAMVVDNMAFDETFILPFVRKHLGDQAVEELGKIWPAGTKPIPPGASPEEKYEVTYGNWIWLATNSYFFVRKRMGEEGIKKFEQAEVEGLIKKNTSPALSLLKIIRAISPGTAFQMTAKKMGYQFQWLTPFSVTELTRQRSILDIPRCKILDFEGVDDICYVGCQSTYPKWVAGQFKVNMKFTRQGKSCSCSLTPLT